MHLECEEPPTASDDALWAGQAAARDGPKTACPRRPLRRAAGASQVVENSLVVHDELLGGLAPCRRRVLGRRAVRHSLVRAREAKRVL